jgi:hypothetical protein
VSDEGHLVDRRALENFRTALASGKRHGPWTRATCAAVLRTLDAAEAERDRLAEALQEARPYVFNRTQGDDWRAETARSVLGRVDAALAALEEK